MSSYILLEGGVDKLLAENGDFLVLEDHVAGGGTQAITGATVTVNASIVAGGLTKPTPAPIAGATLTAATSIVAGGLTTPTAAPIAGATLIVAASIVGGGLTAGGIPAQTITGQTVIVAASIVTSGITGTGTRSLGGATLTATVAVIAGGLTGSGAGPIAGAAVTVTASVSGSGVSAGTPLPQTITGATLTVTATVVAGGLTGGITVVIPATLLRIVHRHIMEIDMAPACGTNLVTPRLRHRAGSTHPIGVLVRQDGTYLDGSDLTWSATAVDLSGADVTPWDSITVTGQVGSQDTPSVTIAMIGVVVGLWLITLVGVAAGVREVVDLELEVVGNGR